MARVEWVCDLGHANDADDRDCWMCRLNRKYDRRFKQIQSQMDSEVKQETERRKRQGRPTVWEE